MTERGTGPQASGAPAGDDPKPPSWRRAGGPSGPPKSMPEHPPAKAAPPGPKASPSNAPKGPPTDPKPAPSAPKSPFPPPKGMPAPKATPPAPPKAAATSAETGPGTKPKAASRAPSPAAPEPPLPEQTLVGGPTPDVTMRQVPIGPATRLPPAGAPAGATDAGIERTLIGGQTGAGGTIVMPAGARTSEFPEIPGVTITREIGRGGMGVVYEGKQGYLDRRVAVKVLVGGNRGEDFTRRFQREAKLLASLNHPNVVACYQAGLAPDGSCFLAMEFIDGPDLAGWIAEHGPLPPDRAVALCRDVASALAYAHRSGVIHRDVKPANVLLQRDADAPPGAAFHFRPKLADLGLARATSTTPTSVDLTVQGLTVQGTVMGSPPTMAPEQFDAPDEVDFRTDIYGLGCVLFHSLTGKLAFPQNSLTSLIARKTSAPPPDPRELRPDLAPELSELVGAMLARSRDERPASYADLVQRLEAVLHVAPRPVRRRPPAALVAGGVAAVALAGWLGVSLLGGGDETEPVEPRRDDDSGAMQSDLARRGQSEATDGRGDTDPGAPTTGADGGTTGAGKPLEPDAGNDREQPPDDSGPRPDDGASTGDSTETSDGGSASGDGEDHEDPAKPASGGDESGGNGDALSVETSGPVLARIAKGEDRTLLSDSHASSPLADWTVTAGPPEVWTWHEDSLFGAQGLDVVGRSAAERALPAAPWTLSSKLEIVRPRETKHLGLVLGFEHGRGIELCQSVVGGAAQVTARVVERSAGAAWTESAELPALALEIEDGAKGYWAARPVVLTVSWDGERLTLAWRFERAAQDSRRTAAFDRAALDSLRLAGPPVLVGIELVDGSAILRELKVQGG